MNIFETTIAIVFFMIIDGCFPVKYPSDYGPDLCDHPGRVTFDFIIVGGGSAGATVAARLSEVPEWNVLLVEAGSDPPELAETPFLWKHNLKTECDWAFLTESNAELFRGMERGRCLISRGRALGGSSAINGLKHLRGTEGDFERWAAGGCSGWGYADVLPYFMKSENFVDAGRFDSEIHSISGPLTVSPAQTFDPAYRVIADAERSLNLSMVNDLNGRGPMVGFGNPDTNTRSGRRCSTLDAFLMPASGRRNLYVAKSTTATRVIMSTDDRTAVGVEFAGPPSPSGRRRGSVYCTKEVILSAGPIKSPQVLMLSGIGPAAHLRRNGVRVVRDLRVGYNLQDHMSLPAFVFTDRKHRSTADIVAESTALLKKEMGLFAEGVTTVGLGNLMAFFKSKRELQYPDLQVIKFRVPYNTTNSLPNGSNLFSNSFGYSKEITALYDELNLLSDIIVIAPVVLHPLSTGRVMLKSTNPLDDPKIFANYLSYAEEKETLLKGIEFIVRLSKTKEMIDAGLVLEELKLPNCVDYVWGTREYWLCAIRNIAAPFFHVVGSCKMGSINDSNTVVDSLLRVKGLAGLRVIDSSVMPKIVSVNTNAASIMIGEKGSDIIKQHYGKLEKLDKKNKQSN